MVKAKTSKKQKAFSIYDMPIGKTKEVGTAYSPHQKLKNVDFTMAALAEAMLDGDSNAIKTIIKNHFEAINAAKVLKANNISKRTFYEAVSEEGNPRLETLTQIVHAMKTG